MWRDLKIGMSGRHRYGDGMGGLGFVGRDSGAPRLGEVECGVRRQCDFGNEGCFDAYNGISVLSCLTMEMKLTT